MTVEARTGAIRDEELSFADWTAPHLWRMALVATRLGPPGERDDVMQEALTRAWRHRHKFDERKGSLSAWLCAITANVARSSHRRRFWWPTPVVAMRVDSESSVDLDLAIGELAPRQRLAIDCFYAIGLSIAETAAVMSCSEGTVKSTLADARARLRTRLAIPKELR